MFGWICSSSYSVIMFSFVSSENYSYSTSEYSLLCYFASIRWVSSWVLSIGLIWSYGSSEKTEFTFVRWRAIVAWGGAVLDVSVFLFKYLVHDQLLWFFWRSCSLSEFFFMNNGPLKGHVYSFPSCCINIALIPLLLIPHQIQSYLRYAIDEFLGIW